MVRGTLPHPPERPATGFYGYRRGMSAIPDDLVRITELDDAWAVRGAGARLEAVRKAGRRTRDKLLAGGAARCVRTVDIATFPYPTGFGLQGAATSLAPYL